LRAPVLGRGAPRKSLRASGSAIAAAIPSGYEWRKGHFTNAEGEKRMIRWLSIVLLLAMSSPALALDDTPQNREQQVDRYLSAVSAKDMFSDMMQKMSRGLPADQRQMFVEMMTKHLDFDAISKAMRDAMMKTFTADELSALADFYASPVGKSAMAKMGDYMAAMMPVMTQEMAKAQAGVQEDMSRAQSK
jgi:hypothetical protein